jgi:hypothetical protein
MAHCKFCHREMKTSVGCKRSKVSYGGKMHKRIVYGDETKDAKLKRYTKRCRSCGAELGHYHHVGCGAEQCPACKRQKRKCNCGACGEAYR